MNICIDPGHGGSDPGAVGLGLKECDVALDIAIKMRNILTSVGYEVILTRDTDVDVYGPYASLIDELQARCDISDDFEADICISIHCNAFNEEAQGVETFYYSGSTRGLKLAKSVQNQIIGMGGLVDRGVKNNPLYMTKHPVATAILVEMAFIDQPDDNARLATDQGRQEFANAMSRGITDYVAENEC